MSNNINKGILSIGIIGGVLAYLMASKNEKKPKEIVIKEMPIKDAPNVGTMYAVTNKTATVFKNVAESMGVYFLKDELATYNKDTYVGLVVEKVNGFAKLKRQINGQFYYCFIELSSVNITQNANDGNLPNPSQTQLFINSILK